MPAIILASLKRVFTAYSMFYQYKWYLVTNEFVFLAPVNQFISDELSNWNKTEFTFNTYAKFVNLLKLIAFRQPLSQ